MLQHQGPIASSDLSEPHECIYSKSRKSFAQHILAVGFSDVVLGTCSVERGELL
jgi:hypothetical protein